MSHLYTALIYLHVTVGFLSLILFWIPIASRKGGKRHTQTGRWYAKAMYVVSGTALVLSLMLIFDPISAKFAGRQFNAEEMARVVERSRTFGIFLLAISLLVLSSVRHGILTLRAKRNQILMRAPSHLALNGLLLAVGLYLAHIAGGAGNTKILFYVFAGLCTVTAIGHIRYSLQTEVPPMEWVIAHLGSMIGAGIGSHTAFFVFGGSRFISELLSGQWMLIPWVGPGVIGSFAIAWLTRKYRNKYRKVRERGQGVVQASA